MKNTIYLADIDTHLPYEDEVQEIDTETLKKSKDFQYFVKIGQIKIVEINDSRIERNLQLIQGEVSDDFGTPSINDMDCNEEDTGEQIQIKIKGHFEDAGGYAKVNRNLALALSARGIDVCIETVGSQNDLNELEAQQIAQFKKKPNRKCIHIDSIVPSFSHFASGTYSILYTTIESYTVPKQFLESAQNYREIWVVSDFCKEILQKEGVTKPIYVIPDTIDDRLYSEKGDSFSFRPPLNDFVFLSVFGWSYRKGYDILLRSYLEEFVEADPVTLLLVSRLNNNPKQYKKIKDEVDKFIERYGGKRPPNIVRCSKIIPEFQMGDLYRACHAFVLFSRGEGFSLCTCEASLCGLPVISTNCTGQSMFLNHDNASLLDIDKIQKIPPGTMHVHYWDNQEFPAFTSEDSIREARQLMRDVYDNYQDAKDKNKRLQKYVSKHYNLKTVSQTAYDRLSEIWRAL